MRVAIDPDSTDLEDAVLFLCESPIGHTMHKDVGDETHAS